MLELPANTDLNTLHAADRTQIARLLIDMTSPTEWNTNMAAVHRRFRDLYDIEFSGALEHDVDRLARSSLISRTRLIC